jgi:DNA adenine methylase
MSLMASVRPGREGQAPCEITKPFLKWVGGKRQLLGAIRAHTPRKFGRYHEPFVGGGAVFFDLRPPRAFLSDANVRLMRAYKGVRENVEAVLELLATYPHEKDFFLQMREIEIDNAEDDAVAAWMIYLNHTAYNGLYRVNSKNRFNVPFGRYAKPYVCDSDNLRACSCVLSGAHLSSACFDSVLDRAERGDFVYFDPPYVPLSRSSSFTSYTTDGFDDEAQVRLHDVAVELKRRGVHVLLSNSATGTIRRLYKGFTIDEVQATRMVNSKSAGRGPISEVLIS